MSAEQVGRQRASPFPISLFFKRLLPTSGALREIAAVDGLRALAILLVLWDHIDSTFLIVTQHAPPFSTLGDFGFSGVYLFFVLSGFLLFLPYARALVEQRSWPSVRQFYLRRVLRILPLYFISLVILLLVLKTYVFRPQNAVALLFGTLLFQDMRSDSFTLMGTIDGPFWTLAIEWQFYLLLPWISLALATFAGKRTSRGFFFRLFGGLGGLVMLGLGIRWGVATMYYDWNVGVPGNRSDAIGIAIKLLYGMKGKYMEVFALGMTASILYVFVVEQGHLASRQRSSLGALAAFLSGIGLLMSLVWVTQDQIGWFVFLPIHDQLFQVLGEWSLGVCFAFLVMAVLLSAPGFQRFFTLAPLRFIGIISYSLYIWHVPLLTLAMAITPPTSPYRYLHFVTLGLLVLIWSAASYYLIERPFIRYRRALHTSTEREIPAV